jgi:5'-nucleotidase
VVGLAAPASAADPVDITILGTNDFHGRLLPDRGIPGAAKYAGAVEALRAQNPNTVFAAAGDLIGATTFESFIAQDKPTIDVLNEMELDVSAVGNHELDQGYEDLTQRVMQPETEANPNGGAEWEYVAANLDEPGTADLIPPSWTKEVGGVTVGFVGAVTEDLPSLVSPGGIEGVTVQDIVTSTNQAADDLKSSGADIVVMLVHEGASTSVCEDIVGSSPTSAFGEIVHQVNGNVDAIVSGHTHLPYSCEVPAPGGQSRWVVSAGQYGSHLNKLDFEVDPANGEIASVEAELIDVNAGTYTADPEVTAIVEAAKAAAEGPGAEELGQVDAALGRAQWLKPAEGAEPVRTDNRGGESTLGNMVAEVQRWATRSQERGGAQIALMNPGGLRTDILDTDGDGFPETVTYRESANVQPFANTLVNMRLTGRQIRKVLEEQWQPAGSSRPFLKLGTSRGFEYTYNPNGEQGARIGTMWLRGKPVRARETYSVTVNSFLSTGGDNFFTLAKGTDVRDTGQTDLQAMVDYMAAKASSSPLRVRYDQHSVGVNGRTVKTVKRGGKLRLKLSSLAMTYLTDTRDRVVLVRLGKRTVGKSRVDNSLQLAGSSAAEGGFDEAGTATVVVAIPSRVKPGRHYVKVVGNNTGTNIKVPVRITRR